MSIKDGGEFWRDVARRLNEENGTRFDVLRYAPDELRKRPRINRGVKVVKHSPRTTRIMRRKRADSRK